MKKLLFIILLVFTANSYCQTFKVGILAGIAGSQVEGDGYGGYNKFGLIGGGFTNTEFSEKWSGQFEIYYIQKGSFDAAHPDKGDHDSFKLNIHYIEIPIVLRYKVKNFKFEIGIYYSQYLGHYIADETGEVSINQYPFKSYDLGTLFGINYDLNEHFIFNLRSTNSILPVRDFLNFDQNIGLFNQLFNQGWYNLSINFSIRYQFGK